MCRYVFTPSSLVCSHSSCPHIWCGTTEEIIAEPPTLPATEVMCPPADILPPSAAETANYQWGHNWKANSCAVYCGLTRALEIIMNESIQCQHNFKFKTHLFYFIREKHWIRHTEALIWEQSLHVFLGLTWNPGCLNSFNSQEITHSQMIRVFQGSDALHINCTCKNCFVFPNPSIFISINLLLEKIHAFFNLSGLNIEPLVQEGTSHSSKLQLNTFIE